MSPGSRYDDGFGPPIDHDDEFAEQHPEDDDDDGISREGDPEEQILRDRNDFILQQLDAKNLSRQYSKTEALKTTTASKSAMNLDGVDWSGFSGKAHKAGGGKPGSSKRLHAVRTSPNEEILEVTASRGKRDSHERRPHSEGAMRMGSSRRRPHSPGKFQSRRASAKQFLNNSAELSASIDDVKSESMMKERRTRGSSKSSRPRRTDSPGGSNHTGNSQRNRRNLRSRDNSREPSTEGITEDGSRP
ncbi:MAG: hypothetical protein SGILL_007711, partial [Bacillariaceae sp.]